MINDITLSKQILTIHTSTFIHRIEAFAKMDLMVRNGTYTLGRLKNELIGQTLSHGTNGSNMLGSFIGFRVNFNIPFSVVVNGPITYTKYHHDGETIRSLEVFRHDGVKTLRSYPSHLSIETYQNRYDFTGDLNFRVHALNNRNFITYVRIILGESSTRVSAYYLNDIVLDATIVTTKRGNQIYIRSNDINYLHSML